MSGEAVALSLFGDGEPVPVVEKVRTAGGSVLEVETRRLEWGDGGGQGEAGVAPVLTRGARGERLARAVAVREELEGLEVGPVVGHREIREGGRYELELDEEAGGSVRVAVERVETTKAGRVMVSGVFTDGTVAVELLEGEAVRELVEAGEGQAVAELEAGDRVQILPGGMPAGWGQPLADVVRVSSSTATVRLCYDGSERRVPLELLRVVRRRAELEGDRYESGGSLGECVHCAAPPAACLCGEDNDEAELEGGPLVVIPCGGAKLPRPAPAAELYCGSYFRAMLRAALELTTPDRVRILSGRYGFVTLEDELEPYEQRIDEAGAVELKELRGQLEGDPVALEAGRVLVLAGRAYAERAAAAFEAAGGRGELEWVLEGCGGIGEQLARASELAGGLELVDDRRPVKFRRASAYIRGGVAGLEELEAVEAARLEGGAGCPATPEDSSSDGTGSVAWARVVELEELGYRLELGRGWLEELERHNPAGAAAVVDRAELAQVLQHEGRRCGRKASGEAGGRCVLEVGHWGPCETAWGVLL